MNVNDIGIFGPRLVWRRRFVWLLDPQWAPNWFATRRPYRSTASSVTRSVVPSKPDGGGGQAARHQDMARI
jgi:hypothetical protein